MLGTILQDRKKTTEELRIYHPYTKDCVSLKISEVAKTILSQSKELEIPNTRYSLSLGDHLIQDVQFENEFSTQDQAEYFLKIERSIARALSALLQIDPPLVELKDFGVYFESYTRLENGNFVMNYALEDGPLQSPAFHLTFLDSLAGLFPAKPTNRAAESRLQPVFDADEILNTLNKITRGKSTRPLDRSISSSKIDEIFFEMSDRINDRAQIFEEIYYFANAIFYKIGRNSLFWIQKFLKGLAETQNNSPIVSYLRRLFEDSGNIPFEEIPGLLKGVFLLHAEKITPLYTPEGLKLHCKFPIGIHNCYVDVPRIEEGDLIILTKHLPSRDVSKILDVLHRDIAPILAKYSAMPNLSNEELKWALTGADFKNKKVKFSQDERRYLTDNIKNLSNTYFGPSLVEKIQELHDRAFIDEPSKLFCGAMRRWIQAHPQQIHEISSETWGLYERVASSVSQTDKKTQPWNLLLKDITAAISELPNEGLANFMKMALRKGDHKLDFGKSTQSLVGNPQRVRSTRQLYVLYKDLYPVPKIAQFLESSYLFQVNDLPEIYEKSDFSKALESRISYHIDKDHIDEVFMLLRHLYKLQKDPNTIANFLTILFQKHLEHEDIRLQIISTILEGFPSLLTLVLNNLKGFPLAEKIWITTLSQMSKEISFQEKRSCLTRFLDTKGMDSNQDLIVIKGLCEGLTQKETAILLEECLNKISMVPNARIETVFRYLLDNHSDLNAVFSGKQLDSLWIQSFFALLNASNAITEDRIKFLCCHIGNIPLIGIQPFLLGIVPYCNQDSKQILCDYIHDQFTLLKQSSSAQSNDQLFEFWNFLLKERIFSNFRFRMSSVYQDCFTSIVSNLKDFVLKQKSEGGEQLKKYIPSASMEERSLLAQNAIKYLPYQRETATDLLELAAPFQEDLVTRSLQEFIPFWKQSSWGELDWFRGIHLFDNNPKCQKEFIQFMIAHMEGYPIDLLKKVIPFLNEDIQAILNRKVRDEIRYLKHEADMDQDQYISKLEQFLVFMLKPEFSILSEDIQVYQDICEMSWTLLRQLNYDDRLNQFFKSCFEYCLNERVVPAEKRDEIDLLRLGTAVDCAADLKLSKAKMRRLIEALCSCSDSVLLEISQRSLTKMKVKSHIIVLKALEEKCNECIKLNKFPNPMILEQIHKHLDDLVQDNLNRQQFHEWSPLLESLSEIMMHFRFHPSQSVSLCAGNLARIFVRNEPLSRNLNIANTLVRDVLQFRLHFGAKTLELGIEKVPSAVETAWQSFQELPHLNTLKDLQMYFDFWSEVHIGTNSASIGQLLKKSSGLFTDLQINRSLIKKWIDHYGTLDADLKQQTDVVDNLTNTLEEICGFDESDNQHVPLAILGADLLLDTKKTSKSAEKLEFFFSYLFEMCSSLEDYWVILELYQRFISKWAYNASGVALLGDKLKTIFDVFAQKASLECIGMQSISTPEQGKTLYNNLLLMSASYLHHSMSPSERENMEYIMREAANKLINYEKTSIVSLCKKIKELINYEKQDLELQNRCKDMCKMLFLIDL